MKIGEEIVKYKVGDKVRVRKDLKERMGYGCERFTDAMKKTDGKNRDNIQCHRR